MSSMFTILTAPTRNAVLGRTDLAADAPPANVLPRGTVRALRLIPAAPMVNAAEPVQKRPFGAYATTVVLRDDALCHRPFTARAGERT